MAAPQLFRALVSAQWVAEALKSPRASQPLKLLDASWYLPKLGRDARREFEERHIPGAAFFDIILGIRLSKYEFGRCNHLVHSW